MYKFLYIFFFIATSCNSNESFVDTIQSELQIISFDVVQKQLAIEQVLPENLQILLTKWFNEKVKVNGFDGDMIFTISEYKQTTSLIRDGRRVDAYLSFIISINKPEFSQKKIIKGNVSSFGTLTGEFSLNEFEDIIHNAQSNLILRLSRELQLNI